MLTTKEITIEWNLFSVLPLADDARQKVRSDYNCQVKHHILFSVVFTTYKNNCHLLHTFKPVVF